MCGIFAYIGNQALSHWNQLETAFNRLQVRGPDYSILKPYGDHVVLGFHRLAIIDGTPSSHQPLEYNTRTDDIAVVCNGEIFNYENIYKMLQLLPDEVKSPSDCFSLIPMYKHSRGDYEYLFNNLDAEFACVIYDKLKQKIIVGRDPIGVRPLFYGYNYDNNDIGLASEMKGLNGLFDVIKPFPPGHYMIIDVLQLTNPMRIKVNTPEPIQYYDFSQWKPMYYRSYEHTANLLRHNLTSAVHKRLMSDKPIACLLSGGLDSSLIVSICSQFVSPLHCFTIGLSNSSNSSDSSIVESPDVLASKKVVDFLRSQGRQIIHHIVDVDVNDALKAIPDVVHTCESWDTTTIRASTMQYLLAKYISQNTDFKVILVGELSDELCSGYVYSKDAPTTQDMHDDACRLVKDVYMFDGLRTDRTMARFGLEVRLPFADLDVVNTCMTMNPEYRQYSPETGIGKLILRQAFNVPYDYDSSDIKVSKYLPMDILTRPKEALSDGVSNGSICWFKCIQDYAQSVITDEQFNIEKYLYSSQPKTKEQLMYCQLFSKYYGQHTDVIKYYWLPKFQATDVYEPSATVLQSYIPN